MIVLREEKLNNSARFSENHRKQQILRYTACQENSLNYALCVAKILPYYYYALPIYVGIALVAAEDDF